LGKRGKRSFTYQGGGIPNVEKLKVGDRGIEYWSGAGLGQGEKGRVVGGKRIHIKEKREGVADEGLILNRGASSSGETMTIKGKEKEKFWRGKAREQQASIG